MWTRKELYKYIVKGQPAFKPGEEHRYSNSNYVLLGLICEKVTGKEYEELLHEKKLSIMRTWKYTYYTI